MCIVAKLLLIWLIFLASVVVTLMAGEIIVDVIADIKKRRRK